MIRSPEVADHPARVLIVDAERHNRQLLEIMLAPEGYQLQTAASGSEALAMVEQQPPDLILLDIMMPEMDGNRVARTIKSNHATRNIPIIMVTALDDREARMIGLKAGAEDFLSKPVDRAELCVRVRNLLRLKAYGDHYDTYSQILEAEVVSRTADVIERTKASEQQAGVVTEQTALLDLAQAAIIVRDMDSRILFWSRGAEVMYGWPSQEAIGRISYALLKAEFQEPLEQVEATLLRDGHWQGEPIHYRRDGTRLVIDSRWALQRDAEGAPVRILTINNDITDRKQTETDLRLLTERLWLATAVARVGVWEWDVTSDALTWDATMFDIYGVPSDIPMRYERWAAAVYPEDLAAVEDRLRRAVDEKNQTSGEFRIILPDGAIRHVSMVSRAISDASGTVTRLIGVNMDVTERTQAEEALEQIRKDQVRFKEEFLSHVSHELRSPLTAIKQFTSILLGGSAGALNDEQRQYQEIVLKNIRQLQAMIDDLLDVTRLETGKLTVEPERASVSDAVTDSLHTLQGPAGAKGVTLSSDLLPDLPPAYADHVRLRQILIILLDNAIKFTPAGGAVAVRARLLPQDPRFLLLEVADTGCGISPETAEKVFDRLYQVSDRVRASRQGLGLGLYICKELVTRQGGQIWVKGQAQRGSTFSFTLPVFSLDASIAPLFRDDQWPAESVALVMVEICLMDAWSSRAAQDEWSREASSLVQRCLLPELDVLVPAMSSSAEGERFLFVVRAPAQGAQVIAAFVDEQGASVLATRIREQFDRLPHLKQTGLTVSVSYSLLEPFPPNAGTPTKGFATELVPVLDASTTSPIASKAARP